MSDNDKFQECLNCSGCSCDCGQGCGSCQGNKPTTEAEGSLGTPVGTPVEPPLEAKVETTVEITEEVTVAENVASEMENLEKEAAKQSKEVEINPMDLDEVAEKTEDLRPKIDPSRGKLDCFNYLADIPGGKADYDIVEVQFKNTRKGFYRNTANLDLKLGDMVAVESQPGHDIGRVTLVGHLVRNQMKKAGLSEDSEIRKIFRFARESDMEKYYEAKALEIPTMIGSRQIAAELGLKMKIGDVEYQGDGLKAIFYYIADERVDFRQLIKILAERFKIRVEMRQIGARQEAGRIGGIGPCGRPLCCSTWMTNFVTVATSAARHQDLSLNPQKLAGQCAKLKCCLNFEIDTYLESVKKMPPKETRLETLEASWYHFKTDIFKGEITYSSDKKNAVNTITITAERAFEIIEMNARGEKPLSLIPDEEAKTKTQGPYNDILGDDSQIGRFDKKKKKKKKKKDKEAAANAASANAVNDSIDNSEEDIAEEEVLEDVIATVDPDTNTNHDAPSKANERPKFKQKNNAVPEAKAEEEKTATNDAEVKPSEPVTGEEPKADSSKDEAPVASEVKESKENEEAKEDVLATQTQSETKEEPVEKVDSFVDTSVDSKEQDKSAPQEEKPVEPASKPAKPANYIQFDEEESFEIDSDQEFGESSNAHSTEVEEENQPSVKEEADEQTEASVQEKAEVENTENSERSPEHKHHHQNHHHHHNHDNHDNRDNNGQMISGDNVTESSEGKEQNRKGNNPNNPNNPNKPQWQGKNQGKGFKPQQGKGQEQFKNREQGGQAGQGKGFKPQQGKGADQPQHQHGQQPRNQQPGQQPQVKEQFKPKGQNQSQDRHNNKDNQGKAFKAQRPQDGGQRPEQQGHQGQGQNQRNEEFRPQGGSNFKKKKNKKPYPQGENGSNPNQGGQHGDQGRQHNQGHHNPNRPQQGPRPSQNQGAKNQNPSNGNGD